MTNRRLFFADLIGQTNTVARLKAFSQYFSSTNGVPGHVLLIGDDGMGKSTMAITFANERDVWCQEVDTANLEASGDLTAIVTNLRANQILLFSNLQRLRRIHVDKLRQVLRDGELQITIGQAPTARNHVMDIKPFTLVATCLKKSDCPEELLDEFSLVLNLQPYSTQELQSLATQMATRMGTSLDEAAAELIAKHCDGRPSHLESKLLQLTRAINKNFITEADVSQALVAFGISTRRDGSPTGSESIMNLSGRDFEALITTLLTRMGFQAEMTQVTGDGGIDIIALLNRPISGGRYLFQCKRYTPEHVIGAPTVRDFYGAVTADRAVKGIFITTSDFTRQAQEFAERAGVELINLTQLNNLLLEYGVLGARDE